MSRSFALLLLMAAAPHLASACGPLFVVERSLNANIVVYEVDRAPGGIVDPKRPVRGHWVMLAKDGHREELSALEKRLAYGVDVLGRTNGGGIEICIRALRERRIEVRVTDECPTARTPIQGRPAILRRVFVQLASTGFIPKISHVELHGQDAESGEEVEEHIHVSGQRSTTPSPPLPAPSPPSGP